MRTYKTVIHFNKPGSKKGQPWTVHYRGVCYLVSEIQCQVPMVSEWKPNKKTNPRAFFTAQVSNMKITSAGVAILT
jgi:hypothetical protein